MDERIGEYVRALKNELSGIPAGEAEKAVGYYEEYLSDAVESGKDAEELIGKLGPPQKIAAGVKAEISIAHTQRSPGLKNFTGILKYAYRGVTTPIALFFVSLFVLVSYLLVVAFFASALALVIGAAGALSVAFYEASAIPPGHAAEILGAAGIGLLSAGMCLLVSFWLYKLGRLFIVAASGVIRRIQKKNAAPRAENGEKTGPRRMGATWPGWVFLGIFLLGLALFSVSGLPVTYFTIFNSMKPENVSVRTMEYDPARIDRISVVTAHSRIVFKTGDPGRITVSYEQPDWLSYTCAENGSTLSFREESNGRLPLFKLVKLHESRTELVVSVPEGYSPKLVTLESTGGFITVSDTGCSVYAKTYTGNIALDTEGKNVAVRAFTERGSILKDGRPAGTGTDGAAEYRDSGAGAGIELYSSMGNIAIG